MSLGGLSSIGRLSSVGGLSSIGGLATIGLGGAFRAGGLMGGAVGLRAPQVVTLSQAGPTLRYVFNLFNPYTAKHDYSPTCKQLGSG